MNVRTSGRIRKYPATILIPLFFLIACSDTTVQDTTKNTARPGKMILNYSSIENPYNPYNFVGRMHNDGLDYIISHRSEDSISHMTYDEISTLDAEFFDVTCDSIFMSDRPFMKSVALTTLNMYDSVSRYPVSMILDSLELSSGQRTFYYSIMAAITADSVHGLSSMSAGLNIVETSILNSSLSDTEKCFPLAIVSIAKHSALYHDTRYLDGSTDPVPVGYWKKVVEADAEGGAYGAFLGFVGGAVKGAIGGFFVGGPIGSLGGAAEEAMNGAIVGGVVGAVGGSMHEALKEPKKQPK